MKRFLFPILLCTILLGCSEKYVEGLGYSPALVPRYLSVSPTEMQFTAIPGLPQSLIITSADTPWKIDNDVTWVKISSASGNSSADVPVKDYENTVGDVARTGIFYFTSAVSDWEYNSPISVTQAGAYPVINFSRSSIEL